MTDSQSARGDRLNFYWGAASGSARKALRQLEEPNVMINYATKLNEPWPEIERLFVDSGGYSFMKGKGEYETTDGEYLNYVARVKPERFALRDYPCERDIRREHGRTVADHQRMTTQRHRSLVEKYEVRDIDAEPVAVLQGYHSRQYLSHLDGLRDRGLLTPTVAIGTLCGREDGHQIRKIVTAVRASLSAKHDIHAFGVKLSALKDPKVLDAVDSADSNAFDFDERKDRTRGGGRSRSWRDVALFYLKHKRQLTDLLTADEIDPSVLRDPGQLGLGQMPATDGGRGE